jgi:hypothetical protein
LLVGIFPECGWLRRSNGQEIGRVVHAAASPCGLTEVLASLLDAHPPTRRASVELLVSDHYARLVHLPWQSGLTDKAQRVAYGRACFERAGLGLDGEWIVQVAFRHFATDGLAYALPQSTVIQVRDLLTQRALKLASIVPVSGVAYWRAGPGLSGERSLVLLEEAKRISAILIKERKYVGLHVQPAGASAGDAVRRVLGAVNASFENVKHVQHWSAAGNGVHEDLIREQLPSATVETLDIARWH